MHTRRGFTLIELMVVIAIIGILATIGLVTYTNSLKNSRDSRRKSDLEAIATALEVYYQKNGKYPYATSGTGYMSNGYNSMSSFAFISGSDWLPELDPYISKVPNDPLDDGKHLYIYYTANIGYYAPDDIQYSCGVGQTAPVDGKRMVAGQYYVLSTFLENVNDPDSNKNKNYAWCDGRTQPALPNYFRIQNGWTPDTCPAGATSCS